jgi:ElaB/YqjD/DUF883 family membrane-anchored ribosome-binding protein
MIMSKQSESTGNPSTTEHLREKAGEVAGKLHDIGSKATDAAREQYDRLRDTAGEYFQDGRERARQWRTDLEGFVQEKPIKSLLIAAGVGMLVGFIWRRR